MEDRAMKARNMKLTALALFVTAGVLLGAFGIVRFDGDIQEAFVYLGSGTAAMSFVLLMVTLFPPAELKKAMQPGQAGTTRLYFRETMPAEIAR
jgi:hypothetical protein